MVPALPAVLIESVQTNITNDPASPIVKTVNTQMTQAPVDLVVTLISHLFQVHVHVTLLGCLIRPIILVSVNLHMFICHLMTRFHTTIQVGTLCLQLRLPLGHMPPKVSL